MNDLELLEFLIQHLKPTDKNVLVQTKEVSVDITQFQEDHITYEVFEKLYKSKREYYIMYNRLIVKRIEQ